MGSKGIGVKKLITAFLFIFIASALATQLFLSFQPHETTDIPDGKHLLFFHAQARCPTCINMEKLIRKVLDDSFHHETQAGKIGLMTIPYDVPENRELVEQFHVGAISVILAEKKNGQIVRHRDLSPDVWNNHSNNAAMTEILSREITRFLNE